MLNYVNIRIMFVNFAFFPKFKRLNGYARNGAKFNTHYDVSVTGFKIEIFSISIQQDSGIDADLFVTF